MPKRIRLTYALLVVSAVVACGGTVEVEPTGNAGASEVTASIAGSLGIAGGPGSAGAQPLNAVSGSSGSATGGAAGAEGPSEEAGAPSAVETCVVDGVVHPIGDAFSCECNTCWCEADGIVYGTQILCEAFTCPYAGEYHQVGETFLARDRCNMCICEEAPSLDADWPAGRVSCTEKDCGCDPGKEWYRHYASTSAATCALIDYACPAKTVPFGNACGCGCEQAVTCPRDVQCPFAGMSCDGVKADCPYSR